MDGRGLIDRLRWYILRLKNTDTVPSGMYPRTAAALDELQQALASEFAESLRPRPTRQGFVSKDASYSRLYMKIRRGRDKVEVGALEKELATYKSAKTVGGRVSQEWIMRVMLAAPHTSGRALAHAFNVVAGFDEGTVSRPTIGKIKDAWVEMYIPMVLAAARTHVDNHLASAMHEKRAFATLTLVHVQDSADLRLRSGDARDGPLLPRRGRASKVQLHVVNLVAGHRRREIPTELEAHGDKSAKTLTTSLEKVLRGVVAGVIRTNRDMQGPEIWFTHILLGDGIGTNEAAAKLLWACVQVCALAGLVRYFLFLVKCAVHQAALTAKSGVIGAAAKAAGGEKYKEITGVAVRLYKYLLNDYYEEFCTSAYEWVFSNVRVVGQAHPLGSGPAENSLPLGRGQPQVQAHPLGSGTVAAENSLPLGPGQPQVML